MPIISVLAINQILTQLAMRRSVDTLQPVATEEDDT